MLLPMTLTNTQFDKLKRDYSRLMMHSMDHKSLEPFALERESDTTYANESLEKYVSDSIYDNLERAQEDEMKAFISSDEMKEDIKENYGDEVLTDLLNNL